ncbi:MAG: EAL domain-containing protein [Proteobacteria bacterium]|nr:EAL domain-containing protein [Pseudomonadota bacterium]
MAKPELSATDLPLTDTVGKQIPVRILIADISGNLTGRLDSLLRSAGIATRVNTVSELDSITDVIKAGAYDLLFCATEMGGLAAAIPGFRTGAPKLPIILISSDRVRFSSADGLMIGATDVIGENDAEHMLLVTRREISNVCQTQALVRSRMALAEAEQRCQLLLQSSRAAIAYVHEGMHIYGNAGYLSLFGLASPDDLLGLPLMDLVHDDVADDLKAHLKTLREDNQEITTRFMGLSLDGSAVNGDITLAPAEYEGERCTQVIVRVAGNAETNEELREVELDFSPPDSDHKPADTSKGTVVPINQAVSFAAAQPPLRQPAAAQGPQHDLETFLTRVAPGENKDDELRAIFFAVIDDFEELSRNHGLRASQSLARQVAKALIEAAIDLPFALISPHQFALGLNGKSQDDILHRVENLRAAIDVLLIEVGERTIRVTMSFAGVLQDQHSAAAEALDSAYIELKKGLKQGRNRISMPALPEARVQSNEAADTLRQINDAIDDHSFTLLFQPIISLKGDAEEHYEVFLRMLADDGKHIAPGNFLQAAIDNGVANKIDRWVVLQSIKMLSSHRADGHNTRLSINVTSNSLTDPEFIDWLGVAIKAARMPSDAVIFQVAEPDAANYVRQTRDFVEGLKGLHCRASLNRFTGDHRAFDLLSHIPVDLVKLDGSLVSNVADNEQERQQLIECIQTLQELGKLSIVPMVESAQVLSILWQAGANYIQGYYLQEPTAEMSYDFTTDN